MLLKIERMNHTGEGIGYIDEIVYFASKTVPGDIIEVEDENVIKHKKYNQIIKYKLEKSSPKRIKSPCPYYEKCGGCQLMNLPYEEQLAYKKEKVKDIFKKYSNLEIDPTIIPSKQYHYRNKITLQVKNGILGLFSNNTNDLIPIENCLLIPAKLNEIIVTIKNKIDLTNVNQIILKIMQENIMIQFLGNIKQEEVKKELSNKVSSIFVNDYLIYGESYLKEQLSSYQFYVSPNSFFQVNHEGTLAIYNKAKEYLGTNNNHILDLYCGTGTIGIYVSKNCQKITGIELNESSVKDAKKNIKLNSIQNMNILKGDVGKVLKEGNKYDAIIVDPPRSGLDKRTLQTLLKIQTPKIIYISCNPMTLARDINYLEKNYKLEKINLVDMFPNSYHVETVCVLTHKTL